MISRIMSQTDNIHFQPSSKSHSIFQARVLPNTTLSYSSIQNVNLAWGSTNTHTISAHKLALRDGGWSYRPCFHHGEM
ncbi:uncharacterized protein BKA55DRAFT_575059 [Fusarium redolens]|uniref:Uncharacterized protein n=1 Tax=Fusarium redolens TaxID=48865 RepID=A0A9P9GRN4_FUSRE|nr:uncharacterized protein BKA55DRAFT_575059 [Fusarium redolens]KAH7243542.1 hypothetical protein BKA55DRAFT_575059 [Fusarium redolens]